MLKPLTPIKGFPLRGGVITRHDKALLPFGGFSELTNVRGEHPGFRKRPGQIKLHTTADPTGVGTNEAMTLYQFRKNRIDEKHFFAQFSDGDVLKATADPPTVTTGVFGAEVHDGSASQIPASWCMVDDIMIYSNGVDQHQIYAGDTNYVRAFVKYDGSGAPADIPEKGFDYSTEVTDGLTTTAAILDSLNTIAAFECIYICTPIPANKFTFTMGKPNGDAAVGTLKYRKSDASWADTTETDGTISGTATLGQTGSMTWTHPTDEVPHYMFGKSGFWYQWETATQLDVEVEITKVTYGSAFQNLRNVWDGMVPYAVEVQVEGTSQWETYGSGAVDVGALAGGKKIMIASADPIQGIYIDVGSIPNATGTTLTSVKYWDGDSYTTVGTTTDGTSGLSNSGWLTFPRKAAQPTQFNTDKYYAYWYEVIFNAELAADMIIAIFTMPYFDIEELGKSVACCTWKERGCYNFTLWGEYIYVSASYLPLALNGSDFGVLLAGDGRSNKVIAMRRFYNELMVWQEEKGTEGGCVTIFQGYDPGTYGKLVLSSKVGSMNAKSVAVVDGVMTSTATEEKIKTLAFFLSRYGVCVCDGKTIEVISDDIQNYFDPTETECIRRGYEGKMFLEHDSAFNVIRIGLVTGTARSTGTATATTADKLVNTAGAFTTDGTAVGDTVSNATDSTTALVTAIDSASTLSIDTNIMASGETYSIYAGTPNIFPVFDLTDKTWSFDELAHPISCLAEVEAGSGNIPIIQVAGGVDDGTIYQSNTTQNDVSAVIDSYLTMELNYGGEYLQLMEVMLRCAAQAAGNITATFTKNSISAGTKTLSMIAETTGQTIRRHRFPINIQDQNISIKLQHATASQDMKLLDMGLKAHLYDRR